MDALAELVGDSPALAGLRAQVARLVQRHGTAPRLPPILIQGETGTGKGLLARLLHRASPRAAAPFVDVNCAAIPATLLEAEMFGYERGAFTDARQSKPGLFRAAHGGTIFLDEIALMPEELQAKLLKAIEEHAVRRLGSTRNEPVDAWVVAATNTDLATAVRRGSFRADLYHRLAVMTFTLPPLRERAEDVLVLAERFLPRACADYRLPAKTLASDARAALLAYPWPGNVRELSNVLERAVLLSDATTITANMLGLRADSPPQLPGPPSPPHHGRTLDATVGEHLQRVLEEHGWNISRAAAVLGVARNTLRARIARHDLTPSSSARDRTRARAPTATSPKPAHSTASGGAGVVPATSVSWEPRRLAFLRATLVTESDVTDAKLTYGAIDAVAEKVGMFAGQVVDRSPEGLIAVFGLDLMEDPVGRATSAALAISRLAEHTGSGVRLGLHVQRCLVAAGEGRHEIDLDSKQGAWGSLNAVLSAAGSREVWASAETLPFLRGRFDVETGETNAAPPHVRIGGRASPDIRSRTPFVGRQAELAFLKDRLVAARAGQGQLVGLVGEPGAGKSRLVAEFRGVVRQEGLVYVEGACVPHGGAIPYLPMIDLLRETCGIAPGDTASMMMEKVRVMLRLFRLDVNQTAPYLLPLLGLGKEATQTGTVDTVTPQAQRMQTITILREIALAASRRGPVVLVVEDLHWIDQTSEACLTALTDSLAGAPILVLATYRASYRPGWLERSFATQMALSALSAAHSSGLVRSLLPARVPDDMVRALVDRGDGNPFFLEELARAQRDDPSGRPTAALPESVQAVLQLRIDRLPVAARRALLLAAVVGRRVPRWLLEVMWAGPDDLDSSLRILVGLEFLYERGGDEPVYAFRHVLTREVADANLPVNEQQALHAIAAEALERRHRDRLEPVLEHLARHYVLSSRTDKAVHYLARFAEKAARTHAHTEAVRALDEALIRVEGLPEPEPERAARRADLLLRQAASLVPLGRFQEARDRLLAPALQSVALTDMALAGPYHFLQARVAGFLGAHDEATASAERAIVAGRRVGDDRMMGKGHAFLALNAALVSQGHASLEHGYQALSLLEGTGEQGWVGVAHWAIGLSLATTGEFTAALDAQARARASALGIGDRAVLTMAAWAAGSVHAAMGNKDAAIQACEEAVRQAPDPLQAALARGWLGYAYVEQRDPAAAIPLLEQSTRELATFGFARHGWFRVFLAEAYRQTGRLNEAAVAAKDGLVAMTGPRLAYGIGWGYRVLGRVAQAERAYEAAEGYFQEAHRTFGGIEARYELARTELDLAALAEARADFSRAQGYRAAAQSRLEALGIRRHPDPTDAPVVMRPQGLTGGEHEARQASDVNTEPLPRPLQSETP